MAEPGGSDDRRAIPSALILERSGYSIVWVIPLVAALIGAFLVFKALSESGPDHLLN